MSDAPNDHLPNAPHAERRRRHRLVDEASAHQVIELVECAIPDSLALKLTCSRGGSRKGELTYGVQACAVNDPIAYKALHARPWWVTESLVDDAIWSSRSALSWLAGGRAVTVIRQPELKARSPSRLDGGASTSAALNSPYLLPDFAFVSHGDEEPVWLVELEKDGLSHASKQLEGQLMFGRANDYFGDERVVLLGVDTRATWEKPDGDHRQAYWHLARAPGDEAALWLVLARERPQHFSPSSRAVAWRTHPDAERAFLSVEVPDGKLEVFGPEGLAKATVVRLMFHTAAESGRRSDQSTCCHPGYMMKFARLWLADLAERLVATDLAQRVGDWSWRVDHGTGRGNTANKARLFLYFDGSDGMDAKMTVKPLADALTALWEGTSVRGVWAGHVQGALEIERQKKGKTRRAPG